VEMKYWVMWEMMDLKVIMRTISERAQIDMRKLKKKNSLESDRRALEKLNTGKNTIKTMFMSKDGKVSKITNLTH